MSVYFISRAVARSDRTRPTRKCCFRKELESTMKALLSPPNTVEMKDDWLVVEPICSGETAGKDEREEEREGTLDTRNEHELLVEE